uniref:Uncharacterized protein n=1 Tax=Knipowitschia caucasica TaxID=637954 RepID=A0AAV2LSA2_KNICA
MQQQQQQQQQQQHSELWLWTLGCSGDVTSVPAPEANSLVAFISFLFSFRAFFTSLTVLEANLLLPRNSRRSVISRCCGLLRDFLGGFADHRLEFTAERRDLLLHRLSSFSFPTNFCVCP